MDYKFINLAKGKMAFYLSSRVYNLGLKQELCGGM